MGLRIRYRSLIKEVSSGICEQCQKVFEGDKNFCPTCGTKLKKEKLKIYANWGKNGITSFTYILPNGISINSRGTITANLGKGISYTQKTK